jgi:perosamine synthetase
MSNRDDRRLALCGGPRTVEREPSQLFRWPVVTREDERAVLEVLRRGAMSATEVTRKFEAEFAAWLGTDFALGYPNGTEAIRAALWACGVGAGDEIICPSMTYWASAVPALSLGAAVHFADIDPHTLCLDPADVEHRVGPRTRAIVVVHYAGYPCDMEAILQIARRHDIRVIEDLSHAQGSFYRGRKCGTLGDIAAVSLMSGKSLPAGEAGMAATSDRLLFERCIAYGHYERTGAPSRFNPPDNQITDPELARYAGIPIGGFKHRMNQTCAAMGRVQLEHYDRRIQEIQRAMNHFWDCLEGAPLIRAHRTTAGSGSTMGGWYYPHGLYRPSEQGAPRSSEGLAREGSAGTIRPVVTDSAGGLSCARFCEAVRAEGVTDCYPGANDPLHLHPVFHSGDLFRQGKPTMVAFGQRDVRQGPGSLPVSESIEEICFSVPWFKRYRPRHIDRYAAAFRKVAEGADQLLDSRSLDTGGAQR